jgi:hypothetical protein
VPDIVPIYGLPFCCTLSLQTQSLIYAQAVDSWLKILDSAEQRTMLGSLFDKYVSAAMSYCSKNFKTVTPVIPINQALTICKILEGLLSQVRVLQSFRKLPAM